jgi:hypothetical protein
MMKMGHIFEYMVQPNLLTILPRVILDKLVLHEVSYHTLMNGVGATLARDKKLT